MSSFASTNAHDAHLNHLINALPDDVRRRIRLVHLPDDFDRAATDMAILREGEVLEI